MSHHEGKGRAVCLYHGDSDEAVGLSVNCCPACAARGWAWSEARPERGSPEAKAEVLEARARLREAFEGVDVVRHVEQERRADRVEELVEHLRADAGVTAEALAAFYGHPPPSPALTEGGGR